MSRPQPPASPTSRLVHDRPQTLGAGPAHSQAPSQPQPRPRPFFGPSWPWLSLRARLLVFWPHDAQPEPGWLKSDAQASPALRSCPQALPGLPSSGLDAPPPCAPLPRGSRSPGPTPAPPGPLLSWTPAPPGTPLSCPLPRTLAPPFSSSPGTPAFLDPRSLDPRSPGIPLPRPRSPVKRGRQTQV